MTTPPAVDHAIDHLVLLVNDLDAASRDFAALGFTVLERADTSHGATIFRFVAFADGSYLLLTAFTSEAGRQAHRLGPVMEAGEGWADYSFTVADAHATAAALQAAGHPTRGPVSVSNLLAGGEAWGLNLVMTGRGAGGDVALPFVVSDVEGRSHRIPGPLPHANGAQGIRSIAVTTAAPEQVAATLAAIGAGNQIAILPLDTPGSRPGGGILSVEIATSDASLIGRTADLALSHNAPIRFVGA